MPGRTCGLSQMSRAMVTARSDRPSLVEIRFLVKHPRREPSSPAAHARICPGVVSLGAVWLVMASASSATAGLISPPWRAQRRRSTKPRRWTLFGQELLYQAGAAAPGRVCRRKDVIGRIEHRETRPGNAGRKLLALFERHSPIVPRVYDQRGRFDLRKHVANVDVPIDVKRCRRVLGARGTASGVTLSMVKARSS